MRTKLIFPAGMVLWAMALPSLASSEPSYIHCKIEHSIDEKGILSPTVGSDVFVVDPQDDGSITYTVPSGCLQGTLQATSSDTELRFQCTHAVVAGWQYTMTINRVSGEYEKLLDAGSGKGLLHKGHCLPAKRQF